MPSFLKKKFDPATLDLLADFICGDDREHFPEYRSSSFLTRFFENAGVKAIHDGSTRKWWVLDVLKQLPLDNLENVILRLLDIREYKGDRSKLVVAAKAMNDIVFMEDLYVVFSGKDPVLLPLKKDERPIVENIGEFKTSSEEEFLNQEFKEYDVIKIGLNEPIEAVLKGRIFEARQCLTNKSHLSSVIMAGSALEGILLGVATKFPASFQSAKTSPKDKDGKVLPIQEWKLAALIDTAHEIGFLGLDVKKFGHTLRDFRNYIHPFEQCSNRFAPDEHTAKISLQVLNAAIADLIRANEVHC